MYDERERETDRQTDRQSERERAESERASERDWKHVVAMAEKLRINGCVALAR